MGVQKIIRFLRLVSQGVVVFAIVVAPSVLAQPVPTPPFEGLPPLLHAYYPEQKKFIRFEQLPDLRAPMLMRLELDSGEKGFSLADVFDEEFFALLPERTHIRRWRNAEGLEGWDYPTGTKVIHRIFLRTVPRTIFELRIIYKRNDGNWAYGLYAPTNPNSGENLLRLHRESKMPVVIQADIHGFNARGNVRISGNRLPPRSCQACHFAFTPAKHQYEGRDQAGPCGFVPQNPAILKDWAPAYKRAHGYWPF